MYYRLLPLLLLVFVPLGCDYSNPSEETDGDLEGPTPRTELKKAWDVGSCAAGSESNHTVLVAGTALEVFRDGDVLYTFSPNGICAGKSAPFAGKNFAFPVWGDDSMTEAKDGLLSGEEIVWVLVSSRFSRPARVFISQVEGPVRYVPNGITVVKDLARD